MRTYREEANVDPVDRPTWVDGIDNPYLHGPYTPVISEITAVDLKVSAGEIPADLSGAYMRNGPNPVLEPKEARGSGIIVGRALARHLHSFFQGKVVAIVKTARPSELNTSSPEKPKSPSSSVVSTHLSPSSKLPTV